MSSVLNRAEFARLLAETCGISTRQATKILQDFVKTAQNVLVAGDSLKLSGLGTLIPATLPARTARDPRNNTTVEISTRKTIRFRPSKQLRMLL